MTDYIKPLPEVNDDSRSFWDAAKRHDLVVQKCLNCGTSYFPVSDCSNCDSPDMEWAKASGKGVVHTYTIFHQRYHRGFADAMPYNVAVIKLTECPFMLSNVIDCKNEDLKIGMPVEVVFDDIIEEYALPKFRPAEE